MSKSDFLLHCYKQHAVLFMGYFMHPHVAELPETKATYALPGLLLLLVDEKVSYPPVPSPTSLTPPQLFSPG